MRQPESELSPAYIDPRSRWNQTYSQGRPVMGDRPNEFFTTEMLKLSPGRLLLPGEGEGRNGVFAAEHGWSVDAFDVSDKGRDLALQRAKEHNVSLNYWIAKFEEILLPHLTYDVIAIIDVFPHPAYRARAFRNLQRCLKRGGRLLLECFSPANLLLPHPVGPKSSAELYTAQQIKLYLPDLKHELVEEKRIIRSETEDYVAMVVQVIAIRP